MISKTTIKFIIQLILEVIVIWYSLGMPIPTTTEDTLKLIFGGIVIAYTGWKNHNFTSCSQQAQKVLEELKEKGRCLLKEEDNVIIEETKKK